MTKKYYSTENRGGSEISMGFANMPDVKVWASKKQRDDYLETVNNLSAKAIKRSEVTYYATYMDLGQNKEIKPRPFAGERWAICPYHCDDSIGLLGTVEVANVGEPWEPLN